jgi:amino acid adenylation domain-containing protein
MERLRTLNIKLRLEDEQLNVRAPKGVMTQELAAELKAHKEIIIKYLKQADFHVNASSNGIVVVDRNQPLAPSFGQQRLWFLYELEGPSATYNMPLAIRLHGQLNIEAAQHAINTIVARHEMLRANFELRDQRLVLTVRAQALCPITQIKAEAHHPIEQQIRENVAKAASDVFDLSDGSLIRVTIVHLSDQSSLLLVTMHHIVSDGWSLGLFVKEFTHLYQSSITNTHTPLPPLPVQYADYAQWQRNKLQGQSLTDLLAFWKDNLNGAPELLKLPTDKPRPALMSYRGESARLPIPASMMAELRAISQKSGGTVFMTMLTAFAVLLQRLSGQQDLIIGTTVANRGHADIEPLIGLFINTLALRLNLEGNPTVNQLLARVKNTCLQAFDHQDLPFEQLVEALNPPRSLSYAPLIQVSFDVQNTPDSELVMEGLKLEPISMPVLASKFDLSLSIEVDHGDDVAVWTWNPDLFNQDTVLSLMRHFLALLQGLIQSQDQLAADLPLNTQVTLARCEETYARSMPKPEAQTWLDLFDTQVKKTPQKIAVRFNDVALSYQTLHERVSVLSDALRGLGVRPEIKVALFVERSIDMIVSLLAIMRAGGTYIPLDPNYPAERLLWVLQDAQPAIILTQQSLRAHLPSTESLVLSIDEEHDLTRMRLAASEALKLPALKLFDQNAAYVIFTSGSTGRPKGVQVTHAGLLNFLLSMQEAPGLTANDTLLAVTTISFDIAALELYLPLVTGAELVIAPREVALNAEALQSLISQRSVTHMQATPTAWRLLLDTNWTPPKQFTIFCGGEALPQDLSYQLLSRQITLWNLYGPTETTIWSAVRKVTNVTDQRREATEPVGAPIRNTQIHILDERYNIQPIGFSGELVIGGDGLARGYLNRPDLTADQYRPDPLSPIPGARIYRTGDLARAQHDNRYEFLGRIDSQVKIRGHRIELGEIETSLREVAQLVEAVVLAREDNPGDKKLVAYVLPQSGTIISEQEIRTALRERLPDYMVPAHVITLDHLPQTPNGKIDRKALPKPEQKRLVNSEIKSRIKQSTNDVEASVLGIWREVLEREEIGLDDNFFDLGGHSLLLTRVYKVLTEKFSNQISLIALFQHPTVRSLSAKIADIQTHSPIKSLPAQTVNHVTNQNIAIIGLSGRYPGSIDLTSFWNNLVQGHESIEFFSVDELIAAGIDPAEAVSPNYVPAHGSLSGIEEFDASFFGYTPAEARVIDPQQRLFLQTAWHALEHAGYAKHDPARAIGVFAGCGQNDYLINQVLPYLENHEDITAYQAILGNEKDFIATRVSYTLNLTGPSLNIQTACSTSLVAVHSACRSLVDGECDLAIAGGAAIRVPQVSGHQYEQGMITSPDGHCRAFDANAQGTVWGSGVGAVLLKPLDQAIADQDTIHAVIKGSAINNDGAMKVGFTAPSVQGQAEVIRHAHARAGVTADQITYIEAHGTGTALGDLIETGALTQAFDARTSQAPSCAIGSVKTNIGHLNSAAGIAGLTKVVLSVKHGKIPATLHFKSLNPTINFESTPFFINDEVLDWSDSTLPRMAGVSSFGIGGTNAHAIIAQAPVLKLPDASGRAQLLLLSARTKDALNAMRAALADQLRSHPETELADVAWTLAQGRKSFNHRFAFASRSVEQTIEKLEQANNCSSAQLDTKQTGKPRVVFMFPGQGSQHPGMADHLYRHETVFKQAFDTCAAILEPLLELDIRQVLFEGNAGRDAHIAHNIDETWLTQPILFSIEYALAKLWMSSGVLPEAMIGHSLGEYVAATLSGVFKLEHALALVAARGKLIWSLDAGSMLAMSLSAQAITPYLSNKLSLAAVNAANAFVLAGPVAEVDALSDRLKFEGIEHQKLSTSHAFHSCMLDPVLGEFEALLRTIDMQVPTLPFISNVTGDWITPSQAIDPVYWVRHMRETVLFDQGITTIMGQADSLLIEVGPGATLGALSRRHPAAARCRAIINTLPRRNQISTESEEVLLWNDNLAKLWCAGYEPDWLQCWPEQRRARIPLPLYPFENTRHWIDATPHEHRRASINTVRKQPLDKWFYIPDWEQTRWPALTPATSGQDVKPSWLVFSDDSLLCKQLIEQLRAHGHQLTLVKRGSAFQVVLPEMIVIDPDQSTDYALLFDSLKNEKFHHVLHAWLLSASHNAYVDGYRAILNIASRLTTDLDRPISFTVLSLPTQNVTGIDDVDPHRATVRGIAKVVAQEFQNIAMQCIDIGESDASAASTRLTEALVSDLLTQDREPAINYRGARRYTEIFRPVTYKACTQSLPANLREGGVYLITGGLGRMGLKLAAYLAEHARANLVLLGRSPVTPEQLIQIKQLENTGVHVMHVIADVANKSEMTQALQQTRNRFGTLHGVIHAAGSPSAIGFINSDCQNTDSAHYRNKIEGTQTLYALLKDLPLDFVALMSSTAAILGGLGFAAYSAANIFMDAIADKVTRQGHSPWLSINWDAWQFDDVKDIPAQEAAFWMEPDQAIEAFARIVDHPLTSQVIVASADVNARYAQWLKPQPTAAIETKQTHGRPELDVAFAQATTQTERTVSRIWCDLLGYKQIGVHDDFFELGGDSMLGIRLIGNISHAFGHRLPLTIFLEHPTVHKMALAIENKLQDDSFNPLITLHAQGDRAPLFCVPGTGGSVIYLNDLARLVGKADHPFYGLQAIGLDGSTAPLNRIEDIAAANLHAVLAQQPHGPYYLAGHSFGSWVALEMARQLEQAGHTVARLFILDTGIPSVRDLSKVGGWDDSRWLMNVAETIEQMYSKNLLLTEQQLAGLAWEDQVKSFARKLIEHGIIAPSEDISLVRGIIEVFKTQAQIKYSPPNDLKFNISLIRAEELLENFLEGMPDMLRKDPSWGWNAFAKNPVGVEYVPGNHLTMVAQPHVKHLADRLVSLVQKPSQPGNTR